MLAISSSAPGMSTCSASPGFRRVMLGMRRHTSAIASKPNGRFTKNTQCHDNRSVRKPPSRGPTTLDTPKTAPNNPWYFPRSAGGYRSAMTEKALV